MVVGGWSVQEALAYFLRSFGNAVCGLSPQSQTEPPLLLNMGFSVWDKKWPYKQSEGGDPPRTRDYTNPVHMHK